MKGIKDFVFAVKVVPGTNRVNPCFHGIFGFYWLLVNSIRKARLAGNSTKKPGTELPGRAAILLVDISFY
jgi:hypothetical protein